ncbi:MAG: GIY-YIG nuclease family protein [Clostridiales bacterium]|nr:GIY-YIG nuclease family protein [Clostridiales bacterium]MCF8023528.1 GIY-YIG nuclease family protein [Clostridiales bacterium]
MYIAIGEKILRGVISFKQGQSWYLYMLKCCDGSLYTGITVDMEQRIKVHREGRGSKYVFSRTPFTLVALWKLVACRSDAASLERQVKSLPKDRKWELVRDPALLKKMQQRLQENIEVL